MKDAKNIISHLVKHPSMKKYEQMRCYDKLLSLLPKNFTHMVRFLYTKDETLFFVFNHPSAKMEFNYKRSLIKSLLSQILLHFPECECLHVKDIQCFVTNKPQDDETLESKSSDIFYEERADGIFENRCDDAKLQALFEEIRKAIQSHKC